MATAIYAYPNPQHWSAIPEKHGSIYLSALQNFIGLMFNWLKAVIINKKYIIP